MFPVNAYGKCSESDFPESLFLKLQEKAKNARIYGFSGAEGAGKLWQALDMMAFFSTSRGALLTDFGLRGFDCKISDEK